MINDNIHLHNSFRIAIRPKISSRSSLYIVPNKKESIAAKLLSQSQSSNYPKTKQKFEILHKKSFDYGNLNRKLFQKQEAEFSNILKFSPSFSSAILISKIRNNINNKILTSELLKNNIFDIKPIKNEVIYIKKEKPVKEAREGLKNENSQKNVNFSNKSTPRISITSKKRINEICSIKVKNDYFSSRRDLALNDWKKDHLEIMNKLDSESNSDLEYFVSRRAYC